MEFCILIDIQRINFKIVKDKTVMTVINKLLKLLYSFTTQGLSERAVGLCLNFKGTQAPRMCKYLIQKI
jgi:hypothetical protein